MHQKVKSMTNHQRKGTNSNAKIGRNFESEVRNYFSRRGLELQENFPVPIGLGVGKKNHSYDLVSETEGLIVECKSHKWTESGNVPSAKMTTWNEVMLYFHASPNRYRKMLVVLRDFNFRRKMTLAQYYIKTNWHLIPPDVQICEYDEFNKEIHPIIADTEATVSSHFDNIIDSSSVHLRKRPLES
jgi:hypothetical protein